MLAEDLLYDIVITIFSSQPLNGGSEQFTDVPILSLTLGSEVEALNRAEETLTPCLFAVLYGEIYMDLHKINNTEQSAKV